MRFRSLLLPLFVVFLFINLGVFTLNFASFIPGFSRSKEALREETKNVLADVKVNPEWIFRVNVPALFGSSASVSGILSVEELATLNGGLVTNNADGNFGTGEITASNVLYGLTAGSGIAVGEGQTPTITNTGVLSVGGSTGAVDLSAGTGISVSGLTITNSGVTSFQGSTGSITLTAGTGIGISGTTITNSAPTQWTSNGTSIGYASGNVGIGTTAPSQLFDVSGGTGIVGQFSGRVIGGDAVNSNEFATLGQISGGAGQYWQRNAGALSPTNITDDVLVGGTSTGAALLRFSSEGSIFFDGDLELTRGAANRLDLSSGDRLNLVSGSLEVGGTTVVSATRLVQAADGAASGPGFAFASDATTGMYRAGASTLGFATGGSERLTIDGSGVVTASGYGAGVAQFSSGGVLSSSALNLAGGSSLITGVLPIANGGTNGTATPTAGGIAYGTGTAYAFTGAGISGQVLTSGGSGTPTWQDASGINYWVQGNGVLYPKNASVYDLLIGGEATGSAKFAFMNVNSGTPTASIAGNLAIAAPTGVNPATTYTALNGGSVNFRTSVGGDVGATSRLFIANNGNIGIGTTAPTSFPLEVAGNIGPDQDGTRDIGSASRVYNAIYVNNIYPSGSGTQGYWQRSNQVISPTNISDDLLLGGTATASALIRFGGTSGSHSFFNTGGNVGIGMTTTPTQMLDVTGNIRASGNFVSGSSTGTTVAVASCVTSVGGIVTGTATCGSGSGGSVWRELNGAISPYILSLDVLLGSQATSSAKIAFINMDTGTPTASISGNLAIAAPSGANPATTLDVFNGGSLNVRTSVGGDAGATSRLFLANNGSVGVGTSNPSATLDVWGYSTVSRESTSPHFDLFSYGVAASSKSYFTGRAASGSSGTPGQLSSGDIITALYAVPYNGSNFSSFAGGIEFYSDGSQSSSSIPTAIRFKTTPSGSLSSATRMTIDNMGNVGIGTTAPGSELHVTRPLSSGANGKALAIFDQIENQDILTASASGVTKFVIANSGNIGIGTTNTSLYPLWLNSTASPIARFSNGTAGLMFGTADFTTAGTGIGMWGSSSTLGFNNWSGPIVFQTANSSIPAERMRIDNVGNVGIGTTTPGAKLDVNGIVSIGGDIFFNDQAGGFADFVVGYGDDFFLRTSPDGSAGSLRMVVKNDSGNIGIGTTVPQGKLQVSGSTTAAQGQALVQINQTGTTDIFTASTSGIAQFVIKNDGNVGINQGTAKTQLDVAGAMTLNRFGSPVFPNNLVTDSESLHTYVDDSNVNFISEQDENTSNFGGFKFYMDNDGTAAPNFSIFNKSDTTNSLFLMTSAGNLGIGTTNPSSFKLEVAGNIGPEASGTRDLGSASRVWNNVYANNFIGGTSGIAGYWQRNSNALSPTNITDDVLIGGTATSSALIKLGGISNATTFFNTGGNVGIGTTAPVGTLDVAGNIYTTNAGKIYPGNNSISISSVTADRLRFVDENSGSGATAFYQYFRSGTNNPVELQLFGTDFGADSTNYMLGSVIMSNSTGLTLRTIRGGSNTGTETITLSPANSAAMTLLSGGNVGVGTTNPASFKLQVAGNIGPNADNSYDLGASPSGRFRSLYLGPGSLHIQCTTGDGCGQGVDWALGIPTSGAGRNSLQFGLNRSSFTSGTPALTISQEGNIGLGTTTPATKLHMVLDDNNFTSAIAIQNNNAGSNAQAKIQLGVNSQFGYIFMQGANMHLWNQEAGSMNFYTNNGSNRLSIGSTGNIGIGSGTPLNGFYVTRPLSFGATGKALAVFDQIENQDILAASASGTTRFVIKNDGNVGIGTTLPTAKLQVAGNGLGATALTTSWPIDFASADVKANTILNGLSNSSTFTLVGQQIYGLTQTGLNYTAIGQAITSVNAKGLALGQLIYSIQNSDTTAAGDAVGLLIDSITSSSTAGGSTAEGIRITDTITNSGTAANVYAINSLSTAKSYFAGNLGIGTTAPTAILHVAPSSGNATIKAVVANAATNNPEFSLQDSGGSGWSLFSDSGANSDAFNIAKLVSGSFSANYLTVKYADGNVGIGTTAPAGIFDVRGGTASSGTGRPIILMSQTGGASSNGGNLLLSSGPNGSGGSNGYLALATGGVISGDAFTGGERMRITTAGNVGIGQTAPLMLLHVGSTSVTDGTSLLRLQDANSGCDFNANAGSPTCGSDLTLKKDINSLDTESLLTKISNLRPVSYHWKTEDANAPLQFGFIAQEVEQQFPNLVSEGTWVDGTTRKFLNMGALMPYVVGAVKELDQKVTLQQLKLSEQSSLLGTSSTSADTDSLLNEVEELKNQVASLSADFARFEELTNSTDSLLDQLLNSPLFSASSSAIGNQQSVEDLVVGNDLTVLGRTTLSDLGVTGNITAGTLSINGLEGSINTIGEPLKLQSLGVEGVDILDGKVRIDTEGNITSKGEITVKKVNVDESEEAEKSIGDVVIEAGESSIDVSTEALTPDSRIFVTSEKPAILGARRVGARTFRIELDSALSEDLKVSWWIVN